MRLYKIYTEDVNRETVEALVREKFDSFSVQFGTGYYKDEKEASLTIEILALATDIGTVRKLARSIKTENQQDAVLLVVSDVQTETI
jgi:hypothetical protein